MTYLVLAIIFFTSIALILMLTVFHLLRISKKSQNLDGLWNTHSRKILIFYCFWFGIYIAFIIWGTGPINLEPYPLAQSSPYKLPWQAGISRFVSQGNRSFTSHRDLHLYAWDFWMPIGTPILAARDGKVIEVEDSLDGIGFKSNYILIEHPDGTRADYAHIRHNGAVVKVGDVIHQGELIAYSGMVGQTINPHLHFVVFNKDQTSSIPISFADVQGGVPLAGHTYTSDNVER